MILVRAFALSLTLFIFGFAFAKPEPKNAEDHQHEEGEQNKSASRPEESEEETASVGPNKGIVEFDERFGFRLSPEALKNFDLKFRTLGGNGPWSLPKTALVQSGEDTNLFRRRNGFFKRVDFRIVRRSVDQLTVNSDDLRANDEVVLNGLGFLRIAEIAATGGSSQGHSH